MNGTEERESKEYQETGRPTTEKRSNIDSSNYLGCTAIVGRVCTGTVVATPAAGARHNLVRTARLALLVALQMGHIFNSQRMWGAIRPVKKGWATFTH